MVGGVAVALLLGPPLGLTLATVTGDLRPEHVGPFGPVVAALPWQGADPQRLLAERAQLEDRSSRTLAGDERDADVVDSAVGPVDVSDAPDPDDGADGPGGEDGAQDTDATETPEDEPAPSVSEDAASEPPMEPEPEPAADAEADPGRETTSAAGSTPKAGASATQPAGPGAISAEGVAVVEATNAERAAAGCGPVTVDDRLTAAGQLHSEDMLAEGYFDHTSLDGRSPWDRIEAQGYPTPGAENIARGQRTAAEVVAAWMDSPGHRANILNCGLKEIGVGHADAVWTQVFGWG